MNAKIKTTKRNTYINFGGKIYATNNDWANKEIVEVSAEVISERGLDNGYWVEIGEHEDLQAAYFAFIGHEKKRKEERNASSEAIAIQRAAAHAAAWDAIKDLEIIPSTLENIRTVLLHLNGCLWGGWKLPKMSISYSAAQFDCDGVLASTMKLDKAVEGSKKFKVGGKNGHLSKYTRL
jgi:hypothetical protein